MDKSLIINEIKKHLGFKKDIDFATFLGISQSTLSSWHKRGSINYELIIAKCKEIDANWLLTGKGQMIKKIRDESLGDEKTSFNEDLNTDNVAQLKNELEGLRTTIHDKEKFIDLQIDLIDSLKFQIETLKNKLGQKRESNL